MVVLCTSVWLNGIITVFSPVYIKHLNLRAFNEQTLWSLSGWSINVLMWLLTPPKIAPIPTSSEDSREISGLVGVSSFQEQFHYMYVYHQKESSFSCRHKMMKVLFLTTSLGKKLTLPMFWLGVLVLLRVMKLRRETTIYSCAKACRWEWSCQQL